MQQQNGIPREVRVKIKKFNIIDTPEQEINDFIESVDLDGNGFVIKDNMMLVFYTEKKDRKELTELTDKEMIDYIESKKVGSEALLLTHKIDAAYFESKLNEAESEDEKGSIMENIQRNNTKIRTLNEEIKKYNDTIDAIINNDFTLLDE